MQAQNEELWRVQLGDGELRRMTIDELDEAFHAGVLDAGVRVMPPGSSSWTTLGEAAGLEAAAPMRDDAPSLAPVAVSAPSLPASGFNLALSTPDLDLSDGADELRPRRRGLLFGGVAAVGLAALAVAFLGPRLGSSSDVASNIQAAAVQAPAAAVESLPSKPAAEPQPQLESGSKPPLTDAQKRQLLEADKSRDAKVKAKSVDSPAKAPVAAPKGKKNGLLESGDRFDPLNGAL